MKQNFKNYALAKAKSNMQKIDKFRLESKIVLDEGGKGDIRDYWEDTLTSLRALLLEIEGDTTLTEEELEDRYHRLIDLSEALKVKLIRKEIDLSDGEPTIPDEPDPDNDEFDYELEMTFE